MTIAADLVSAVELVAGRLALPRVRALHLPPPSADGTRAGEFCALELEGGAVGLSFILLGDTLARLRAGEATGVAGAPARDVARAFATSSGAARAVGMAAVNAITALLYDRAGWELPAAGDTIGELRPGPGEHVGMIGLFPPLVPRVLATGARLTVVELQARLAGRHEGWEVTLDPEALRACTAVVSTSTILLNDTLDAMVARCAGARAFALVGPGAGCLPDPLFARGVTLVGGNAVVDRVGFLEAIATGAPWGKTSRKTAISREAYPGLDALLARAAAR
jgi:uncharacterized protein (DUF4213/DUF364 family)